LSVRLGSGSPTFPGEKPDDKNHHSNENYNCGIVHVTAPRSSASRPALFSLVSFSVPQAAQLFWRHDTRWLYTGEFMARRSGPAGEQVNYIDHLALKRGKSVDFTGYWQRHIED